MKYFGILMTFIFIVQTQGSLAAVNTKSVANDIYETAGVGLEELQNNPLDRETVLKELELNQADEALLNLALSDADLKELNNDLSEEI